MPSLIIALIVINVAFSYAAFSSREIMGKAIFNPYIVYEHKEWWRFITSGFIHADWPHLIINMYVLYMFGETTLFFYRINFGEQNIYYFLLMYFGGMIVSHLPSYQKHKHDFHYNSLGASGAVSSVVFAYIVFQPFSTLYLFFVIPLPAILFGVLYVIYSYQAAKRGQDNIGHEAHLWGAIFGFVFTMLMKPDLFSNFIDSITGLFQ